MSETEQSEQGTTYRIKCVDCGAVAFVDPGDDVEWDKRYHRMHHCPGTEFEVRIPDQDP